MGGDRYKQTNRSLRSLMDLPPEKSRESKSKSRSKPRATDQPRHVVFDIGANGDVVVQSQNLAQTAHASGRNNGEDVAMTLEAEEPDSARSRRAAQALDVLGDVSLFVPWIERRSSRPT
jgi:hypothetical protein